MAWRLRPGWRKRSVQNCPSTPTRPRASFYVANAGTIEGLTTTARDLNRSVEQRLAALETLSLKYSDAAVSAALVLVSDKTPAVARAAADLLASSIVMSDHKLRGHAALNARQKYVMERHTLAREALKSVLESPASETRSIAAGSLSSLSDQSALTIIQAAVSKGLYSEADAVNYFGLADPKIGAPFILPYLDRGSPAARVAAIGYLGANRSYQNMVRDRILMNTTAAPDTRAAAARVLGQYDREFPSYALSVTLDPKLPANVYAEVVNGYIAQSQVQGKLDAAKIGILKESIRNQLSIRPDPALMTIQQRLDRLL